MGGHAGDIDDVSTAALLHLLAKQEAQPGRGEGMEGEGGFGMGEIVGGELVEKEHAGIVDEYVDLKLAVVAPSEEACGGVGQGEVETKSVDLDGVLVGQLRWEGLDKVLLVGDHDNVVAHGGQLAAVFETHAGGGSGDEGGEGWAGGGVAAGHWREELRCSAALISRCILRGRLSTHEWQRMSRVYMRPMQ